MLDTRKFTGWPSRDNKPIIEIDSSIEVIAQTFNLVTATEKDDLGSYKATHFYDDDIGFVVMLMRSDSPVEGVVAYIDVSVDSLSAIRRLTAILGLEEGKIVWKSEG